MRAINKACVLFNSCACTVYGRTNPGMRPRGEMNDTVSDNNKYCRAVRESERTQGKRIVQGGMQVWSA